MSEKELKYIPISEVPDSYPTKYDKVLKSIPVGKALVVEGKRRAIAMQVVVKNRQKKGRYKNLVAIVRGNTGYVINKGEK